MEIYAATKEGFRKATARYGLLNKRFDDIVAGGAEIQPDDRREIDSWLTLAEATIIKIRSRELDINHTYDVETALEKAEPIMDKYPCRGRGAPREIVKSGEIRRATRTYIKRRGSKNKGNDPSSLLEPQNSI